MGTADMIREILQKAYQIEVDGYTFYSMTADRASKPAVKELFEKLAGDEVEHQRYLREVMRGVDRDGASAFRVQLKVPGMADFSRRVFTDAFRQQAQGAAFEVAVLSIGMQLEANAIAYFSGAADRAGEEEVRAFYRFLADWEKEHLDALQTLHGAVRTDFWERAGFAPF